MNDLAIFFVGVFVSFMVIAAVGILLWGASQEERQRSEIKLVEVSTNNERERRLA